MSADLDTLRAAYRAFAAADLDGFLALLADDFVSTQSDAVPWRGSYRGPGAVREMFGHVGRLAAATFTPEEFIDGGDRIVVVGRAVITPTGSRDGCAIRELHVWRVGDGRLRSLDVFLNAPVELLRALGA